ncbi:hypothetical protein VTK26DRAFT_3722 [Humicola hyalothermophila]
MHAAPGKPRALPVLGRHLQHTDAAGVRPPHLEILPLPDQPPDRLPFLLPPFPFLSLIPIPTPISPFLPLPIAPPGVMIPQQQRGTRRRQGGRIGVRPRPAGTSTGSRLFPLLRRWRRQGRGRDRVDQQLGVGEGRAEEVCEGGRVARFDVGGPGERGEGFEGFVVCHAFFSFLFFFPFIDFIFLLCSRWPEGAAYARCG